jgi:hypothetical protein
MKLRPKQREALEHLAVEPWATSWWGGRPHVGWPKWMPAQTYNSLSLAKLVITHSGSWAEKTVSITIAGRAALEATASGNG